MGYVGMCGLTGYGFSAVLVINRVSILAILVLNRVWFLYTLKVNAVVEMMLNDSRNHQCFA